MKTNKAILLLTTTLLSAIWPQKWIATASQGFAPCPQPLRKLGLCRSQGHQYKGPHETDAVRVYYPQFGFATPLEESGELSKPVISSFFNRGSLINELKKLPLTVSRPSLADSKIVEQVYEVLDSPGPVDTVASSSSLDSIIAAHSGPVETLSHYSAAGSLSSLPEPGPGPAGLTTGVAQYSSGYRFAGPKDMFKIIEGLKEKKEQRKRGHKALGLAGNIIGDIAGILVAEVFRKIGDLAGDITRFGVKELSSIILSTMLKVMTQLAAVQ